MLLVFLLLATLAYVSGTGVDLFPYCYALFVAFVFAGSEHLERAAPSRRAPFLLFSSSLVFSLLAGEAVFRVALDSERYHSGHDRYFEVSPEVDGRYRYTPNVDATRTIFGDLSAQSGRPLDRHYRTERFVTDDRGFRNEPAARERPVDVLILGDSFGLGTNTTQESTWASVLQRKLGEANVYNLSMPGCPSDQVLTMESELPHIELAHGATLLWMVFSGNDIEEHPAFARPPGYRELGRLDSTLVTILNSQRRSVIAALIRRLNVTSEPRVERIELPSLGPQLFYTPYIAAAGWPAEKLPRYPQWKAFTQSFDRVRELTEGRVSRAILIVVPSKAEVYLKPETVRLRNPLAQALEETARRNSFEMLDLTPAIVAHVFADGSERPRALWWPDDTHWNVEGNETVAKLVLEGLEASRAR